jgi:iron complex outermembrane receptor protein
LNTLPQVVPTLARGTNNGGGGLATVDLRGLGPQAVLILINGRRVAPSTPSGLTDLNNIPATLVERVEVITGGASAVYGSDAVSGVVNFIMKKNFEGAMLHSSYKITERGDLNEWQIDGTMGASAADGRGNVTLYGSYYNRDGAFQDARDFSKYDHSFTAGGRGSATGTTGRFDNLGFNPFAAQPTGITTNTGPVTDPLTAGGAPSSCGSSANIAFSATGARGYCNRMDTYGGDRYNFNPTNYLVTPQERFNIAALGEYSLIGDSVKAFVNLFYTNNNPKIQLAPTPATGLVIADPTFKTGGTATANTFLLDSGTGGCVGAAPGSIQGVLCTRPNNTGNALDFSVFRRRMEEVGTRQNTLAVNQFQFISGLEGDLGDGWSYETYVNFSRVTTRDSVFNDVYRDKMTNALKNCVVNVGLFGPGCHSIDFYGRGTMSAADAAYVRIPVMTDVTQIDRTVFSAAVTGSPFELPAGSVDVAFGFEYREDALDSRPDSVKQAGNLLGFNRAGAIKGSNDVSEVFAEVEVPLIRDVPLIHDLTANLAYRLSEYSSVGQTETYHTDLVWEPIESVRFRGSYQRADRAPNLENLFQNGDQSFPPFTDRCAGTPAGALLAQCSATYFAWTGTPYVTPFTQTNAQIDQSLFGNINLTDEKSDTYTIGVVFAPTGWKNFRASVDWYSIAIEDAIGREFGGTQNKIDQCFFNTVGTGGACVGISRSASGDLIMPQMLAVNLGSIETSGVDVQADVKFNADEFGLDPSWGSLSIHLLGTWVDFYDISGSDVTGQATETATLPEYQASASFTYAVSDFRFNYRWSYIDSVVQFTSLSPFIAQVPSIQYSDIAGEWTLSDNFQLYGGVNNLFDQQPPQFENGNSNTDTARYDIAGRTYFMGATIRY